MQPVKKWKSKKECAERAGFYLIVDRQKYGPFLEEHRKQYVSMKGLCGVQFEDVWLTGGWLLPPKIEKTQADKSAPLLEGIGFVPIPRKKERR